MKNRLTRRAFLGSSLAVGTVPWLTLCRPALADKAASSPLFGEAAAAAGWEAGSPGSFYFVQATDLHANDRGPLKMEDKYKGRNFADDIRGLMPKPAFVAITGDLVSDTFRSPSSWPRAEEGFRLVQERVLSRLDMPCHIIMGNNGCSPEAFHKVWTERPAYWSFTQEGVCFVGLYSYALWRPENGNHAGIVLDEEQRGWLERQVAASRARSLVLFTHEPLQDADCHLIRKQLAPVLAKFAGEIWNIAGHNHMNAAQSFTLGGKTVRVLQTSTPVGDWKPDKGVCRLVFASGGRLVGTALRRLTKDGEPLNFTDSRKLGELPPCRTVEEALCANASRVVLVGDGDKALRIESVKVEDRLSNLRMPPGGSVTYKVPLGAEGTAFRQIALAAGLAAVVDLSRDGVSWVPAGKPAVKNGILRFDLAPVGKEGESLYIRVAAPLGKELRLYGFALLPDPV